jgi:multiple sugar transport system substrate-binding protein
MAGRRPVTEEPVGALGGRTARSPGRRAIGPAWLAALCVLVLVTAGCAGSGGGSTLSSDTTSGCRPGATRLAFWGWVPGFERAVDAYNRGHPQVCVDLQNVGAGTIEYTKLVTAFHAGSGAPDIAEIEYLDLSGFEVTHDLADLRQYGVADLAKVNTPALWRQVSQGGQISALPLDSGPVELMYNARIFAKYGLAVPATWQQFASAAAELHRKNPRVAMTNFWPEDANLLFSMMGQDGSVPFDWTGGKDLTIDLTCGPCLEFADYWQQLIDAGAVTMVPDNAAQEFGLLDSGQVAAVPRAAWGPKYFAGAATKTVGDWRVAKLPQWSAGRTTTPMWGGSAYAVTSRSAHKQQAADFLRWLTASQQSWKIISSAPSLEFPSDTTELNSPDFRQRTIPLTGSQQLEADYATAAKHLEPINWPPFMTYVSNAVMDEFAKVVQHTETMTDALRSLQSNLVGYTKREGFTVSQ